MTKIAGDHQKPGRGRKDFSLEPLEGAWLCPHLAFGLSASECEGINFGCFKPSVFWYFVIAALGN